MKLKSISLIILGWIAMPLANASMPYGQAGNYTACAFEQNTSGQTLFFNNNRAGFSLARDATFSKVDCKCARTNVARDAAGAVQRTNGVAQYNPSIAPEMEPSNPTVFKCAGLNPSTAPTGNNIAYEADMATGNTSVTTDPGTVVKARRIFLQNNNPPPFTYPACITCHSQGNGMIGNMNSFGLRLKGAGCNGYEIRRAIGNNNLVTEHMTDVFLAQCFTNLKDTDTDGDGETLAKELAQGTNPGDSTSNSKTIGTGNGPTGLSSPTMYNESEEANMLQGGGGCGSKAQASTLRENREVRAKKNDSGSLLFSVLALLPVLAFAVVRRRNVL